MMRLAKKCSALSKIGLALALFGGIMLAGTHSAFAAPEAEDFDGSFFVNYFLNPTTQNNDVITIVNGTNQVPPEEFPISPSGSDLVPICANLFFFDSDEEPAGCCHELISSSGMATINVHTALTGLAAGGPPAPTTGSVKIVATQGPSCNDAASQPLLHGADLKNQLSAWITHAYVVFGGTFVTEEPFAQTGEPETDWSNSNRLLRACFAGGPILCPGAVDMP
jgi:hypothetical protein